MILILGNFLGLSSKLVYLFPVLPKSRFMNFLGCKLLLKLLRINTFIPLLFFTTQIANLGIINLKSFSCFEDMQFWIT